MEIVMKKFILWFIALLIAILVLGTLLFGKIILFRYANYLESNYDASPYISELKNYAPEAESFVIDNLAELNILLDLSKQTHTHSYDFLNNDPQEIVVN